jgi:protease I
VGQSSLTFTGHEYKAPFQVCESFENMDDATLRSYSAVIVPSAIVSDRLRYSEDIKKNSHPPRSSCNGRSLSRASSKASFAMACGFSPQRRSSSAGRKVVAHNNLIGDVRNLGTVYTDQDVVVDGDLVTGRTGGHCHLFARKIIDLLSGDTRTSTN